MESVDIVEKQVGERSLAPKVHTYLADHDGGSLPDMVGDDIRQGFGPTFLHDLRAAARNIRRLIAALERIVGPEDLQRCIRARGNVTIYVSVRKGSLLPGFCFRE